jgi:energy-coupling factor transport system substrate-specific component
MKQARGPLMGATSGALRACRSPMDAQPAEGASSSPRRYWEVRDLAVIGIFSALAKTISVMVALAGGGMNPLSLILKNLVFTTLLIVLLFKVRKFGTLLLFIVVNTIFGALLMGGELVLLPPMLLAGLCAEGVIVATGGYAKPFSLMLGVAVYDLAYKTGALGLSWLFMREQPQLLWLMSLMVIIGYAGALAGLIVGARFVKELRHAGIVRH